MMKLQGLMFLSSALFVSATWAAEVIPPHCLLPSQEPQIELPEVAPLPTPRPRVTPPQVPKLPVDREIQKTGIEIFDRAINGQESASVLPFWFNYPWADVKTPILWTSYVAQSLTTHGRELLHSRPQDAELFCPNYGRLSDDQRMAFWVRLISAVMEQESTYRPTRVYHSVRVQFGLFSTGLMMLSLPSAQQSRFGCSMIKGQDDLFDWRKNIDCSLRVMSYYFREDNVIASHSGSRWMGIARYWEPFRDGKLRTEGGRETLLKMVKQRRLEWLEEGRGGIHPAERDGVHKRTETPLLRVLRITNQMAFCPSGSPDDYEAPEPWPVVINPPIPTPRPHYEPSPLPGTAPIPTPRPVEPVTPPGCPTIAR